MLLKNSQQVVSSTDLQKKTRELLDDISGGKQEHYVVMRDNKPAAVMMATERYQALIEELEDLRIEAVARARLATPRKAYVSKQKMEAFIESL
jgi:antitoxin StbD